MIKLLRELDFSPDKNEIDYLSKETKKFCETLRKSIAKKKINAEVFVGGSFAKGTMAKESDYDVDVFIRFDWKYDDLSKALEKIIDDAEKALGNCFEKVHGSRDYFRMKVNERLTFEIIPVTKIKNAKLARNITDLSYFHVNFVKKNLSPKLKSQVALAKKFCKACDVYGAESYINGFSGYGLECLIIYYKSFEKMLRDLSKLKERKIIDLKKFYKKSTDALFELNESKLRGPIILIDPTWKERNVLAALSWETFSKFQDVAKKFLLEPSEKFFQPEEKVYEGVMKIAKINRGEFLKITLKTEKQAGDIAGTKMKKFSKHLIREIEKYFFVLSNEFSYGGGNASEFYVAAKSKGEIFRIGPPISKKENVRKFKEKNKKVVEENGLVQARIKIDFSLKDFLERLKKKEARKIREMDISDIKIT